MNSTFPPFKRSARAKSSGFTLVELLVVIALTIILLTLLFAPLIQSFNFTQQAQATAQAQDAARATTEQLSRELASAAGVRDTTNNFLDLPIMNKSSAEVMAHAYNAYIDIIPPRASAGTIVDPTIDPNNKTVQLGASAITGLNQELTTTGVSLPLSAGTTIIRYFVGLRYPIDPQYQTGDVPGSQYADTQPYTNRYEGMFAPNNTPWATSYTVTQRLNNTYQLYRVNFQPYMPSTTNPSMYVPNTLLLPTVGNAGAVPIYDDPDFFRIVSIGDPDYVAGQGDSGTYTTATAQAHNDRVYNWVKIAKEVVSTREIDFAGFTRLGNKVVYDVNGNPVNSYESGGATPILRTTVNFQPGLISDDPMSAANTSNSSQEYGSTPPSQETGLPYVPSQFGAEFGNWQGTPVVTIAKATATGTSYLQTTLATTAGATLGTPNYSTNQTTVATGDLLLANLNTNGSLGTDVYDVTAGAPIIISGTTGTYDAMILYENSGIVSFSVPALPPLPVGQSTAQVPPNTYWYYAPTITQTVSLTGNIDTSRYSSGATSPLTTVPNAEVVVNSERIIGPDESQTIVGTAPTTDMVQYMRVPLTTVPGPNQYTINYATQTITLWSSFSSGTDVQIAYNYQNNVGANNAVDTVRASYYSAAMMGINVGVRVYAPGTGTSQYFSLDSQVGVSNSKAN